MDFYQTSLGKFVQFLGRHLHLSSPIPDAQQRSPSLEAEQNASDF
jgi:hypothetical protein